MSFLHYYLKKSDQLVQMELESSFWKDLILSQQNNTWASRGSEGILTTHLHPSM